MSINDDWESRLTDRWIVHGAKVLTGPNGQKANPEPFVILFSIVLILAGHSRQGR